MASHLWNRTEWGRAALARFFYLSMALDVGVMSEITQLLRDSPQLEQILKAALGPFIETHATETTQ